MVSKSAFWQALVVTIIVFSLGLALGYYLEISRTNEVELGLLESEIALLDEQIRELGLIQFNIGCAQSKQNTFSFADRIYEEAEKLERYDGSNKFPNTLNIIHKRYDLLRMLLWMEGINLKKNCDLETHTVIYIFEYAAPELQTRAVQESLSKLLLDVKNEHQDEILLIPIAGNLDIESVNLILEKYKINSLPAIIVDEKKVVNEKATLEELEKIIFEENGFEKLKNIVYREVDFTNPNEPIVLN